MTTQMVLLLMMTMMTMMTMMMMIPIMMMLVARDGRGEYCSHQTLITDGYEVNALHCTDDFDNDNYNNNDDNDEDDNDDDDYESDDNRRGTRAIWLKVDIMILSLFLRGKARCNYCFGKLPCLVSGPEMLANDCNSMLLG